MRGTSAMSIPEPTIMTPYVSTEQWRRAHPARAGPCWPSFARPVTRDGVCGGAQEREAPSTDPSSQGAYLTPCTSEDARLHQPHSLVAMVPDLRDNRHHQCRCSRQKGSGKGELAVCDGHIGMDTSQCGRDYQSHDSQQQAYRERKQ